MKTSAMKALTLLLVALVAVNGVLATARDLPTEGMSCHNICMRTALCLSASLSRRTVYSQVQLQLAFATARLLQRYNLKLIDNRGPAMLMLISCTCVAQVATQADTTQAELCCNSSASATARSGLTSVLRDTRSSASKEPPREVAEPVIKAYSRQLTVPSSATAFEQLLCPYQRMLAVIRTLDALAS